MGKRWDKFKCTFKPASRSSKQKSARLQSGDSGGGALPTTEFKPSVTHFPHEKPPAPDDHSGNDSEANNPDADNTHTSSPDQNVLDAENPDTIEPKINESSADGSIANGFDGSNANESDFNRIDAEEPDAHNGDLIGCDANTDDVDVQDINEHHDMNHDATNPRDTGPQKISLSISEESQVAGSVDDVDDGEPQVVQRASGKRPMTVPSMVSGLKFTKRPPKSRSQVDSLKNEEMVGSLAGSSTRSSVSLSPSQVWRESTMGEDGKVEPEQMSIAAEIDCRTVVYMCSGRLEPEDVSPISWLAKGQYDEISDKIVRRIKAHLKDKYGKLPWPKPYRLSADVKLLSKDEEGNETLLESDAVHHRGHWAQKVPVLVARHGSRKPFSTLLLEVVWHYDMVDVHGQQGSSLAAKICKVVLDKRKNNWREQWFLSTADLDAIFSEEIIRELINNDESLSKHPLRPDRARTEEALSRWTQEWLFLNASGLLATCIWARLPLSCLRELVVDHGTTDIDRPLIIAPPDVDVLDFEALMSKQRPFWVYNFDEAELRSKMEQGKYEVIENWQTVPIISKCKLGEGGFGLVDEVSIHPGHHTFRENTFALKQLHHTIHTAPAVSKAFERENNVFSNLMGINHPNILVPLAMWRQKDPGSGDRFNMLYSKAKYNLKEHLRSFRTPPRRERQFVEDLVQQLRDLADALDKIHLLRKHSGLIGDDQEQFESSAASRHNNRSRLQLPPTENARYRTAYHHDLKPENILVFDDGTWKISDFGTAGITQAVSGRSVLEMADLQSGDPIYSPPDHAMDKSTARAYDVWCFGCILLEILLTLFHEATAGDLDDSQGVHRLDAFYLERANSVQGVGSLAYFWYRKIDKDGKFKFELREPVKERFTMLYRQTRDFDQFGALVRLAEDMMAIEPTRRPSAERVLARMKQILEQVKHNLSTNESFYLIPGSIAQRWASRPTTDGEGSQSTFIRFTDHFNSEPPPLHAQHLSLPEFSRVRRHSAPSSHLARLEIAGGEAFEPLINYRTAVEETPTSPAVRVHYADSISLGSTDEATASGEEATNESTHDG